MSALQFVLLFRVFLCCAFGSIVLRLAFFRISFQIFCRCRRLQHPVACYCTRFFGGSDLRLSLPFDWVRAQIADGYQRSSQGSELSQRKLLLESLIIVVKLSYRSTQSSQTLFAANFVGSVDLQSIIALTKI